MVAITVAKQNQKVARYPVIKPSGLCLSVKCDFAVTVEAITATSASPTAFPICEILWVESAMEPLRLLEKPLAY